jgi:putative hydrolase of the HAD superfamily
MFDSVKRIFFDSGMVLVYPRSGEWFYPTQYKNFCKSHSLPEKSIHQYLNYQNALSRLNSIKFVKDENEEYEVFNEFYSNLFHGINGKDDPALIKLCVDSIVLDNSKYRFYDDVKESIRKLNCKYELGIISDAWPSLKNVYMANGMLKYFEPFTISSMYGCTKKGYDLFRFALANAAQQPDECLFVDDSYENCKRARKLGMQVLVLNRNKYHKQRSDINHISTMKELENLLGIY